MGRLYLVFWIGSVICACGDDDGQSKQAHAEADAGRDAAADVEHGELERILGDWIAEWDRQMSTQCECLVESGAYERMDECVAYLRSGAGWLDCVSDALADRDSEATRATGRCVLAQLRSRNECLETTECGTEARGQCSDLTIACAVVDPAVTVLISEQCPDTAILPRLP
jgi:hypothetical protein